MNGLRPCVKVVTDKLSYNKKISYRLLPHGERELSGDVDRVLTLSVHHWLAKEVSPMVSETRGSLGKPWLQTRIPLIPL
jgi:hypothetical protein